MNIYTTVFFIGGLTLMVGVTGLIPNVRFSLFKLLLLAARFALLGRNEEVVGVESLLGCFIKK